MADVKASEAAAVRPLSPHLGAYRWTLTMAMSIAHRFTGAALYVGTLFLVWWLLALATDAGAYASVAKAMGSVLGRLILFGFTWALFQHMLGGVRHFIWDTGHGLDHPAREWITRATIVGSAVLTLSVWIVVFLVR